MTDLISIIVLDGNNVHQNFVATSPEAAEKKFVELCKEFIQDFDTFQDDLEIAIENGYAEIPAGNGFNNDGAVIINWPQKVTEDRTPPTGGFLNAHHWLRFHAGQPFADVMAILLAFLPKLDGDDIQDLYQDDMDKDGYFD